MPRWRLVHLFFIPYCLSALNLDQKVSLKLIESLWQEGKQSLAEQEIDKFLSKYSDISKDLELQKIKSDLLIKKKDHLRALEILDNLKDTTNYTKERKLLCFYELKLWDRFVDAFDKDPSLIKLPFGKKIWNVGLAEAIQAEQNIDRKNKLIEKASKLYQEDLNEEFDQNKALSFAVICEEKKDYQKAFQIYEDLFVHTHDDAYQLSMAKMASRYDVPKALQILEPLRWKSGQLGTGAALFSMALLEKKQDFHELYNLSLQELKLAPEGIRKAKISLYHLKSLYYLKCFDRIPEFYTTFMPHKVLKTQDQSVACTLYAKSLLIKNEPQKLKEFYRRLKEDNLTDAQIVTGRILAKFCIEHRDYLSAQEVISELTSKDPLHKDEYLTTLGLCYVNTQAYEVAESYFIKVLNESPDIRFKRKAIEHLLEFPKLSKEVLSQISHHLNLIDLKNVRQGFFWIIEALKTENQKTKALDLLKTYGDPKTERFHQIMGDLLEKDDPLESISHYEAALKLALDDTTKAYLHDKLFQAYFENNKELAADHLFQSINLFNYTIPENLFDGLASYLYEKSFRGIKIYLHEESTKKAASQLVRLFSYKQNLTPREKTLYAKTLRKLFRFEEACLVLKNPTTLHEKLELAKILNQLGRFEECDQLFDHILKERPVTLFLEGQLTSLSHILLQYDRLKSQIPSKITLDQLEKNLRVLSVCIQDTKSSFAFEVDLIRKFLFSDTKQSLASLRDHPYFQELQSGTHRKILNFMIQDKLDHVSALDIDDPLSDAMEWLLIHSFKGRLL